MTDHRSIAQIRNLFQRQHTSSALQTDLKGTVLRIGRVTERLGVTRSTIYDCLNPASPRNDKEFPLPLRLSVSTDRGAIGWLESDICAWIGSRVAVNFRKAGLK